MNVQEEDILLLTNLRKVYFIYNKLLNINHN